MVLGLVGWVGGFGFVGGCLFVFVVVCGCGCFGWFLFVFVDLGGVGGWLFWI